ncbi:hypothetical protein PV377_42040 [Streptomyces ipomoeae]|uniref:hypothetical protein n=1 Tax=Streptomyces ipomoeae TaxID=103232 RepID=UPI0029A46F9F|nr:hypothetical protein [Streptomyces ipomoeae]MDX2845425.1 hypothetical protein [Streptomyces ipomoeae]
MAGVRGLQHKNRVAHPPEKPVRATVILHPGDEERPLYEELVNELGVSGAEVLRQAIRELHKRQGYRKKRAAGAAAAKEAPKAG